jgi:molybdenum cofactor biosynthesis protein MoaC
MHADTLRRIADNDLPKKDPLVVARWAGIQAAKQTSSLIPACHLVPLDWIDVECTPNAKESVIDVRASVKAEHKTGVEMEALTAASIAALTLYDMLKPVDDTIVITEVALTEKHGGTKHHGGPGSCAGYAAGVVVASDRAARGEYEDRSGPAAEQRLRELGFCTQSARVVPDEADAIVAAVDTLCHDGVDFVVTCGGTGLGPRDVTVAALRGMFEREADGIAEWLRAAGRRHTPHAVLSNGIAGVRGTALVVALPGSPRAVTQSLDALAPSLAHALAMVRGEGHE